MYYIYENPAGERAITENQGGYQQWTLLGTSETPPAEYEEWCTEDECFKILNKDYAADHPVGQAHIAKAHAIKQLEAVTIMSGYELTHGVLYNEAALRGITLTQMAQMVLDQAAQFIQTEHNRIESKLNG